MPRRPAVSKTPDCHIDFEEPDEGQSDEDYFVNELRMAVDRARSSESGASDWLEGPRGRGFDRLRVDSGE